MTQIDNPNISATTSTSVTTSWMGWLVWGLACLFYFYECLLQVSPSVMSNELMRDFSVTSHTLGILSGIYFYSYAAMQLPAGLFIDYFGPRRLLSLASLVCGISTFAFGFTHSFGAACLARLMIGFGSAFACVGCMKFAANWFCPKRFPIMMGLMVTMGMLGAIGGEAPLALLIEHFEWRHSMMILGVIGVILAFLIRVFTRDTPRQGPINAVTREVEAPFSASLGIVLKDKRFWTIALYGGLMYLSTPVFCGLWGVPFLMDKFLITKTSAANYVSLVFIGWAVAGPFWGMFSNYIACRKTPLYIANIGALICSLGFLYTSITPIMFLFLFGVFSSAFLPAFT
ncbi:MAG: MFS transporter, partial [Legionellaceae bacterium]|nr:MFS transporter [Legionellaceae bacterium]